VLTFVSYFYAHAQANNFPPVLPGAELTVAETVAWFSFTLLADANLASPRPPSADTPAHVIVMPDHEFLAAQAIMTAFGGIVTSSEYVVKLPTLELANTGVADVTPCIEYTAISPSPTLAVLVPTNAAVVPDTFVKVQNDTVCSPPEPDGTFRTRVPATPLHVRFVNDRPPVPVVPTVTQTMMRPAKSFPMLRVPKL
jgi:hypothetical protein